MNQRLFFLFPDREHALAAVNELLEEGFEARGAASGNDALDELSRM